MVWVALPLSATAQSVAGIYMAMVEEGEKRSPIARSKPWNDVMVGWLVQGLLKVEIASSHFGYSLEKVVAKCNW